MGDLKTQLRSSIVHLVGHRLLSLREDGITFSEQESRMLIEEEFPEVDADIVEEVLRRAGF